MKKLYILVMLCLCLISVGAQEIYANVTVNAQQLAGSNQQVYKTVEKSIRDFINNTSWTGKRLQNFEKIKSNFAFVIIGREGNRFIGTLLVQAVRPVYNTTYESPLVNINDQKISFEYVENENLIFNERQFSGKNLTDLLSFYVYLLLGYDADSFQTMSGQDHFLKAQAIAQNAMNRGYEGWAVVEGPRTRGSLIDDLINPNSSTLRGVSYIYHRGGLDQLYNQDQLQYKKIIADALLQLRTYENTFQMNYAINLFLDTKASEIYSLFDDKIAPDNLPQLKELMLLISPKNAESKWNRWK